ncbi:DEAD/DEAH box helicase [Motilibacter rhizosphaerae]|uniref:DEAD/DEAH box helicase n=1 Tax=Motilibacter rhizosphaerae TaxID=598652 RepID=UPI001E46DFFF|nr:DEAD/DEAH box helicase [Motilibacter rhizosphaerae]
MPPAPGSAAAAAPDGVRRPEPRLRLVPDQSRADAPRAGDPRAGAAEGRGGEDRGGEGRGDALLAALLQAPGRDGRLLHVERTPARGARTAPWPGWVAPEVRAALERQGVAALWAHQASAAQAAWEGRHVVVSTGTASGKSLAYQLPGLTRVLEGRAAPDGRGATVLHLSPTKALAADQARALAELELPGLRAALLDGDTPSEERAWVRDHASWVLSNPDMLHASVLPDAQRWARFLRSLSVVVVDECHTYRGVFGSHVSAVLRRLRRLCARYGSEPVFVLASATVAEPARHAEALTGLRHVEVTEDASPRGGSVLAFWEPPVLPGRGPDGAPARRSAGAESAELLADLVLGGARSLAFVRSRKGAEALALQAARVLDEAGAPGLASRVAAYRAGYLPEDRRALEAALSRGDLLGVASTPALELGVDVTGMDAVVLAGWPGTHASLWQQAGRAGRDGRQALAVLVAADDPLDTYLVHHPEAVVGRPLDATVLDPANPYVLGPHLCAAAAELPLTEADEAYFGPGLSAVCDALVQRGALRRRPGGWYWTRQERPTSSVGLRGTGQPPVRVVEARTGRVLGTVDAAASHAAVHRGAVHVHRGETHLVRELDLEDGAALVERAELDWTTTARELTDITVVAEERATAWGDARLCYGEVEVTSQVVSFARRRVLTGELLGEELLDLPARCLRTRAVWWTVTEDQLARAELDPTDVPGAAHAAEHASIGLLRLVATCDRWDIGGVSTARHPDTGLTTVFVYDGSPGGAGFAEQGWLRARRWLTATLEAVAACPCSEGCPSCVQSPKCGNGNSPLDKAGAVRLLRVLLDGAP